MKLLRNRYFKGLVLAGTASILVHVCFHIQKTKTVNRSGPSKASLASDAIGKKPSFVDWALMVDQLQAHLPEMNVHEGIRQEHNDIKDANQNMSLISQSVKSDKINKTDDNSGSIIVQTASAEGPEIKRIVQEEGNEESKILQGDDSGSPDQTADALSSQQKVVPCVPSEQNASDKTKKTGAFSDFSVDGLLKAVLAARPPADDSQWPPRPERRLMQQLLQMEWVDDGKQIEKNEEYFRSQTPPNTDTLEIPNLVVASKFQMPPVLMEPESACPEEKKPPFLLVLAPSVHSHSSTRDAIRHTWASPAYSHFKRWPNRNVTETLKVLFILGTHEEEDVNSTVLEEQAQYQDILQFDFHDSYFNLTVKMLSAMHWAVSTCKGAAYIAKIDSDTMLNVPAMQRLLKMLSRIAKRFILGHAQFYAKVRRSGKWGLSREIYAPDYYPHYVVGHSYVMPSGVTRELLTAAQNYNQVILPIEDAFITGVLAGLAGVRKIHMDSMADPTMTGSGCDLMEGFYVTQTFNSPSTMYAVWKMGGAYYSCLLN